MIAWFVLVTVVLVGGATLITKWCLEFVGRVRGEEVPDSVETPEKPSDEAVDGIKVIDNVWHEIEFNGRRYRRCMQAGHPAYCNESIGWLYFPEGTPVSETRLWYDVKREYERRQAHALGLKFAVEVRKAWGVEQEGP